MFKKLKIILLVVLSFSLLTTQMSCGMFKKAQKKLMPGGKGSQQQQKKSPKMKIGVSMATTQGDGYAILKKTMDGMKKKSNADIIWKDARNDPVEQAASVDEFVKKKVKAVILQPVDPKASAEIVDKLMQKNIKVVALEKLPVNTSLDGFITPDYARAGELQAQAVAKQVPEGQVLVLAGDQDQKSASQMLASFAETMQASSKATLVTIKPKGYLDPQTAQQVVATGLVRYPSPTAIVAQDPALTTALMSYIKVSPLPKKPFMVGIGADPSAVKALMNRQHDAEVDIRPDLLAGYAMEAAMKLGSEGHLDYDQKIKNDSSDVPVREIPVRLVTSENAYLLKAMWGKELEKEAKKMEKQSSGQSSGGGEKKKESSGGESGSDKKEGESGKSGGAGKSGGEGKSGGQGEQKGKMTKLKITTKEGRTMELEVPGDVQSIETKLGESGKGQGSQGGQGGQGGGGQGGGGGGSQGGGQ